MADIESKTSKKSDQISYKIVKANKRNALDSYRSYTYLFTLASLKKDSLKNPLSYREQQDYFVIAKSAGKGTQGMSVSNIASTNKDSVDFVNSFNKNSPGRFDFYLDNVSIDTIMGFDNRTSLSVATNIKFDVVEPYSMSGFIEALQAAAVAAGYETYATTPFLLKVEFMGYPDDALLPDPVIVPNATRYFVFAFTGLEVTVNESGARYTCSGVPFNERGFGEPSLLKSNVQIHGTTVQEILKSLESEINNSIQTDKESEKKSSEQKTGRDIYEIVIPRVTETGFDVSEINKDIADKKLLEVLKDRAVYKFAKPSDDKEKTVKYDPTTPVVSFAERANIHECIIAIIRDSEYTRDILKNYPKCVDDYGYVDYFIVNLEVEELPEFDKTRNKPFYKYRYIVLPYKIHYTRIPLAQSDAVDVTKLISVLSREYEYLYTGKNVDIKRLELKFNTLYFQAIPHKLGNKEDNPSQVDGIKPADTTLLRASDQTGAGDKAENRSQVRTDIRQSQIHVGNSLNAIPPQVDPYATMAKNLHQAILDNVDQCQVEMEILGDPFYLVTGGIGNYRPFTNADNTVGSGEAPYLNKDVIISIKFRNPVDIDPVTGEAIFNDALSIYSGVFRVITVLNVFKDGVFSQTLKTIRIPAQLPRDLATPVASKTALVDTDVDPANLTTPIPAEIANPTRKLTSALLSDILTTAIPTASLPGELSNFVSNASNAFSSGITSVTGQINNVVQSATSAAGALNDLTGVSSAVRLAQSGLSAVSTNINSAGATINQITNTAQKLGIPGTDKIASEVLKATDLSNKITTAVETNLTSLTAKADQLSSSAMSAIGNLEKNAAGLVSNVQSKIDALKGAQDAISSQLGVELSNIAGLTGDLKTKLTDTIAKAAEQVPTSVDLNTAIKDGLLVNNIPLNSLANIPSTSPTLTAPDVQLPDVSAALDKITGSPLGKLANTLGADTTALTGKIASMQSQINSVVGDITEKVNTVQSGVVSVANKVASVEATLNKVAEKLPGDIKIPNVSGTITSVVNKYGSLSTGSPLDSIMKKAT